MTTIPRRTSRNRSILQAALALLVVSAASSFALLGCGGSQQIHRPNNKTIDQLVDKRWADTVRSLAKHGDWLLLRSYSMIGDAIVDLTPGNYSHSVVYDKKKDIVIEAVSEGVIEVSLERLIHRNDHVMLVHPTGLDTEAAQDAAIARARSALGKKYDYRGLVGVEDPTRFYCSELALWSIDPRARGIDVPLVITPSGLMKFGRTVWYSGVRSDSHRIIATELRRSDAQSSRTR